MNEQLTLDDMSTITISDGSLAGAVIGNNPYIYTTQTNSVNIGNGTPYGTIAMGLLTEDLMDKYEMNQLVVEHRVSEHEMLKLKETSPDYADHIKENLSKNAAREIIKKMSFTKKKDVDTDTHSFRGRIWVFNKEELEQFVQDIRNG